MTKCTAAKPSNAAIRVAVVEDDAAFQALLALHIDTALGLHLHGLASTQAQALALLVGPPADVLLVDLGLPDGSGIEVICAATRAWPHCAVMVCTVFGDEAHVINSIEAGASGYLLKDASRDNMVAEIRSLHEGGSPISPVIARQVLRRFRAAPGSAAGAPGDTPRPELSSAELQVLELITKGFTTDEIARLQGVARSTVLTYVRRIYKKLAVNSRTEAIHEARYLGLLR